MASSGGDGVLCTLFSDSDSDSLNRNSIYDTCGSELSIDLAENAREKGSLQQPTTAISEDVDMDAVSDAVLLYLVLFV